ncbi:MAG: dockerin type I domain-containing protein [bacterium]
MRLRWIIVAIVIALLREGLPNLAAACDWKNRRAACSQAREKKGDSGEICTNGGGWEKYGPVFWPGDSTSWDSRVDCFVVAKLGGQYVMYFSAPKPTWAIGRAVSEDGINWKKDEQPVFEPDLTGWDDNVVKCPDIMLDDGTYKLWYQGGGSGGAGIGYAISRDGIQWTRYGDGPVLAASQPWEVDGITTPTVVRLDTVYMMWYASTQGEGPPTYYKNAQVGLATSADGVQWTKYESNPVLSFGASGEWDDDGPFRPRVVYYDGIFHLWYTGLKKGVGRDLKVGHAISKDGVKWLKSPHNPDLDQGPEGTFDSDNIWCTSIVFEDETTRIWYAALGSDGIEDERFGYGWRPTHQGVKGDVNLDIDINVVDVVLTVNIILGIHQPGQDELWRADFSSDGEVDVLDVLGIVGEILGGGTQKTLNSEVLE